MHIYLRTTAKKINRFNHNIENFMMDFNELPHREELYNIDEEIKYAHESDNFEMKKIAKEKRKALIRKIDQEKSDAEQK